MRILLFTFIFSLTLLQCSAIYARDILVVRSSKIKPYDEALKGFINTCANKINNLDFHELESSGDIVEAVRKTHPALILAIGMEALSKSITIKNTPIVYVMVLNPSPLIRGEKNVTGVSMNVSPEKHFSILHKLLPSVKTVGVLYDPRRNGPYIKTAVHFARTEGIGLVAEEIYSPKEVPNALENLRGKVDLLWILPDITVLTPETTDHLLLFSLRNKIPIHAFSVKYLEMGAFSSLETDPFNMGKQAGEIAARIFSGTDASEIERTCAANPQLAVNLRIAKKLGLAVNPEGLRKAVTIR
jgi:putative ABC transport system substrate-binding protein